MKDGLPYGSVFGGSRGESAPNIKETPRYLYSPEFFSGYVNETKVTIGGYRCKSACTDKDGKNYTEGTTITAEDLKKVFAGVSGMIGTDGKPNATYWELIGPKILGSVFGGGQDGHVRRDTHVIVDEGEIGLPFTYDNRKNVVKTLGSDVTEAQSHTITTDLDDPQWLHRGNVYGAGSGIGKYIFDFDNDGITFIDKPDEKGKTNGKYDEGEEVDNDGTYNGNPVKDVDYSTSAGSVTRFTQVDINGGIIHRNVYGGGSNASVGPATIPPTRAELAYLPGTTTRDSQYVTEGESTAAGPGWWSQCIVNIRGTIGTHDDYQAHYGGEVYGASRGETGLNESFANTVWTLVRILNGANIQGNAPGGGDNGAVKRDTDVRIGDGE